MDPQWGSTGSGDGQFDDPCGVATDAAGDVALPFERGVQLGLQGSADGQPFSPVGIAMNRYVYNACYVVDGLNHCIQRFTVGGDYVCQWGSFGSADGEFNFPQGVAVNEAGDVYVSGLGDSRIQKFGSGSTPTNATTWGRIKSLYR